MPIVRAWEHCRKPDRFYPIDCKHDYLDDLKEEAFYNLRERFMFSLHAGIFGHLSTRHYSITHTVEIINDFKKEFFKTCCGSFMFRNFEQAWKLYQIFKTEELEIDEHNVIYVRDFFEDSGYVDVTVKVLNWGFLRSLSELHGVKQAESEFFFKRTNDREPHDLVGTEIELDFENDCMMFISTAPEICSWVTDFMQGLNVYREIANYPVTRIYDFYSDRDYEYGQIPVY